MSNNHRTVKNVTQGVLKEVLGVFGEIINEVKKKKIMQHITLIAGARPNFMKIG